MHQNFTNIYVMKKIKNKKIFIVILLIIICSAVTFIALRNRSKTSTTTSNQGLNIAPPTADDKDRVNSNKEKIIDMEETVKNNSNSASGKKLVSPTITYAGLFGNNVEVGSFVNGVFETDGSCMAIFTKNKLSFNKIVAAVTSTNSVNCTTVSVPKSEFKELGAWSVIIKYGSQSASGSSTVKNFEIK